MSFKKIFFYLLFLFVFSTLIFQLSSMLLPNYLFLSLDSSIFIQFIYLAFLIFLSGLTFTLFVTLNSWKLILPGIIISLFIPFLFLPSVLALIFAITSAIALLINYSLLSVKLKTYIDFEPISFFNYSISGFLFFFAIISSLTFYLYVNTNILKTGFKIPEPILTTIADSASQVIIPESVNKNLGTLKTIGNSAVLLQSLGLGSSDFGAIGGAINQSANITKAIPTQQSIKESIETQMSKLLKPYYQILAGVLALSFFLILQFLLWIFSLFTPIIYLILFFILDKLGIVKIKKESKMVNRIES